MLVTLTILGCLLHSALAVPQSPTTPTLTIATSTPSPTAALNSTIPSQVPLPPKQDWCPSEIFCAGSLLQTVNLAAVYPDPKTFVDKPTLKTSQQVLSDFDAFNVSTVSEDIIVNFVNNDFQGEGLELEAIQIQNFNPNPKFLNNVSDPLLKNFSQAVHGFWASLVRGTNDSTLCAGGNACESTLIPLNHTFVVPGGRFREQYYWDSFWIIEGLIQSELFDLVNDTLQNFMDELETIGFIPNGGRVYYLNRSQPPLFIHMLSNYIAATNDTSILKRALPLAETELKWWAQNRTLNVTSPYTNTTYAMSRYAVTNTAPRPESYLTDYLTATNLTLPPLNETQRSDLYSELASGAETGWDYTSRFLAQPSVGLPSLNVRGTIPIDLNSILYKAHSILDDLYTSQGNSSAAATHRSLAASRRAGILDLFWDPAKLAFYDFNLTSNARNSIFSAATFYPLWNGIIPNEVLSSGNNAFGFFAVLNMVLNRYNGTFPSTFITTGQQWDAPNAWPPHQYIALQALAALPANITSTNIPLPGSGQNTFDLIPSGQLDMPESQLPQQTLRGQEDNATSSGSAADINKLNGTVVNGGNATSGEGWSQTLQRELANRYFASVLCSWHATGGSIPGLLPRLSDEQLNITQSVNNTGNMFEKFSNLDIDSAGRGGEYTVQAGFGWTNGVLLWMANAYGKVLVAPQCPELEATTSTDSSQSSGALSSVSSRPSVVLALLASALVGLLL